MLHGRLAGLHCLAAVLLAYCISVRPLQAIQFSYEGGEPHRAGHIHNITRKLQDLSVHGPRDMHEPRLLKADDMIESASVIRRSMPLRTLYKDREKPSSRGLFIDYLPRAVHAHFLRDSNVKTTQTDRFLTTGVGSFSSLNSAAAAQTKVIKHNIVAPDEANHNIVAHDEALFQPGETQTMQTDMAVTAEEALVAAATDAEEEDQRHLEFMPSDCPSMFVVVLSSQTNYGRRSNIREMWRNANNGWGSVKATFAICVSGGIIDTLKAEDEEFGDLLFLDCEEGYLNGRLTLKIITSMRTYLDHFNDYELFFKTDDDTFVSMQRLCGFLNWRKDRNHDNLNAYFGVFAEGDDENIFSLHKVERDPLSNWFEAQEDYPFDEYPASAKGGPGYILPKRYVEAIIYDSIADNLVLRNEDKAVGVWVDRLAKRGFPVEYVNLPGTDGYLEYHRKSIVTSGPYKGYPHLLHHHLAGTAIKCLYKIDLELNPELPVDSCFFDGAERSQLD